MVAADLVSVQGRRTPDLGAVAVVQGSGVGSHRLRVAAEGWGGGRSGGAGRGVAGVGVVVGVVVVVVTGAVGAAVAAVAAAVAVAATVVAGVVASRRRRRVGVVGRVGGCCVGVCVGGGVGGGCVGGGGVGCVGGGGGTLASDHRWPSAQHAYCSERLGRKLDTQNGNGKGAPRRSATNRSEYKTLARKQQYSYAMRKIRRHIKKGTAARAGKFSITQAPPSKYQSSRHTGALDFEQKGKTILASPWKYCIVMVFEHCGEHRKLCLASKDQRLRGSVVVNTFGGDSVAGDSKGTDFAPRLEPKWLRMFCSALSVYVN